MITRAELELKFDRMNKKKLNERLKDISYSIRRYFVDSFFLKQFSSLSEGIKILDLGGVRNAKRGEFSVENYNVVYQFANLSSSAQPDFLCDATQVPVPDASYDVVILSEVLEHVMEPYLVLKEVHRILKPGGKVFISVPYCFYYHPNPTDFGRYTEEYYHLHLNNLNYENIQIEKHGLFWSTIADMLKAWIYHCYRNNELKKWQRALLKRFIIWFQFIAIKWDSTSIFKKNLVFNGYTTGYGIVASKKA